MNTLLKIVSADKSAYRLMFDTINKAIDYGRRRIAFIRVTNGNILLVNAAYWNKSDGRTIAKILDRAPVRLQVMAVDYTPVVAFAHAFTAHTRPAAADKTARIMADISAARGKRHAA